MEFLHEPIWTICMWCTIFYQWNAFILTMLDYLCINIQTNYSLMYSIIFFSQTCCVHEYKTRNAYTPNVYVCFQGTTRGHKNVKLLWCPYMELYSWYCWFEMCNWLIQDTHPTIVLVFKQLPYYMIQQYLTHDIIMIDDGFSVHICVNMHMYMHMCATWVIYVDILVHERKCFILEELQHSALFLFCTPKQSAWYNWYWGT